MDNPANWGAGKTRYGPVFFDNVADYNGFTMTGTLNDIFQQSSSRLAGYDAAVSVTQVGTGFGLASNAEALRIDVTSRATQRAPSPVPTPGIRRTWRTDMRAASYA
jgi:hypothetical protein